jgi:pyruvate dehydrogenase E2 component (dihydrolipoamide acetyltransferase)
MATEVRLPQFGMGMQEGKVLRWFKGEGDQVREGDPLCELETEKANVEVPAPEGGILSQIVAQVGATIPVFEILGVLAAVGEPAPPRRSVVEGKKDGVPRPAAASSSLVNIGATVTAQDGSRGIQVTPLARRVAKEHGIDLTGVKGTGPGGRITDNDVRRLIDERMKASVSATAAAPQNVQIEPRARRLAQEHKIDLTRLAGSGPGGRITEQDVTLFLAGSSSLGASEQVIPLTGKRGVIARRMTESLQSSAQLTLTTEANVTVLVRQRQAPNEAPDLTYNELLVKASALALRKHPRLNSTVVGQEIHVLPEINVGLAVALDDGLVVPVVRNADQKPLAVIASEVRELVERARAGRLMMAEITGGTFTVTNLGGFGITSFTPIINPPEAAILGVGCIVDRLVRRDSDMVWQQMMGLSLTVDHRVVDGAPAAAFLKTLCELLERPELLNQ